jgi:hypothetical protein
VARSNTEKAEADRVRRLFDAWLSLWVRARDAFGGLRSGQEIVVGDTRVAVAGVEGHLVIVRAAGKNRMYTLQDMPWKLAVALAEPKLPADPAARNLHVGAFLAVDAYGNREEARRRLAEAGPPGEALLAEVDAAPPVKEHAPQPDRPYAGPLMSEVPGPGEVATAGAGPSPQEPARPDEPVEPDKLPVPDVQAQIRADEEVRAALEADFREARDAQGRAELVRKLLARADGTGDDPVKRFTLLRIARELAVEVGDPQLIGRTIDETARHYRIDALQLRADAIAQAWRSEEAVRHRPALYQESLGLLETALQQKHYAAADRLVAVATQGAKAAKNFALVRKLEEQERTIRAELRSEGG